MLFHDPRREVEKLRDHLASHDKPVSLFIGAGASAAVKDHHGNPLVPTVAGIGELCQTAVSGLSAKYSAAWTQLETEANAAGHGNIQGLLSAVRRKIAAVGEHGKLNGLNLSELKTLETTIQSTIASAALPDEDRIPEDLLHRSLGRWIQRTDRSAAVEIFTTNYDTLIERGLEAERVAIFDGFVGSRQPFFSSQSLIHDALAPGRRWTRLWKIHGSINWSRQPILGRERIVRGSESTTGELILPSFHKYDESRKQPYAAMLERLHRVLTERDDAVLVTIGYSFGDEHINGVIFDALEVRDRTHVFALLFSEPPDDHVLVKRAGERHNLLVYGPSAAIVGGTRTSWRLLEAVDARTAGLLDVPFDSDAVPDDSPALTGRFRLGDFVWFTRFLDSLASS